MSSLAKNSIYNVIYKVLNIVFPLITSMYVAHILMAGGIGKIALAQNVTSYFLIVSSLGIPNYGVREIAKVHNSIEKRSEVFWELFFINMISTTFCTVAYYLIVSLVPGFSTNLNLYLITGINLLLNYFNCDWFYQGIEEFKYITTRSFVIKCISFLYVIFMVRSNDDLILYALVNCIAVAGNNIFNIVHIRKYINLKVPEIHIPRHIKPVLVMLASTIAVELYSQIDTTMLGFTSGEVYVGYYNYAIKMAKMLVTVFAAISTAMLPRLSFYYKQGMKDEYSAIVNRVFYILLLLCPVASIGLSMTSKYIIPLFYGDSFIPAISAAEVLSFLLLIMPIGNLFGTQVLLSVGKEKFLLLSTVIGAIVNIALNSILIPIYQHLGAAIASVVAELCVLIIQIIISSKYCKVELKIKKILKLFSALAAMIIVLKLVEYSSIFSDGVTLLLDICLGGMVYLGICYIMKYDELKDLSNIIKTRRKK